MRLFLSALSFLFPVALPGLSALGWFSPSPWHALVLGQSLKGIQLGGLIAALKVVDNGQNMDILYSSLCILELKAACFHKAELVVTLEASLIMQIICGVGVDTLQLTECRNLPANWV
ncbi:uncharacterized protein BJ212DRAFT_1297418 [Suillus subaureus]|uniref:Hydrophobin n=1 Tax=Suillus subaureus TaxID=48587 RepID=A0A9P7EG64_9AGAM|nr:uncharacterized protein BJ212DRAFT_1297418 [Suillus subaureus]KAG1820941.1 hypothetical protein BJ212DRAFT_1297418 [Suillus subaureus]